MYIELGFFTSPEEFLQSPYLPILPEDLINPYTGKPVEAVPGIWKNKDEFLEYFKGTSPPPVVPPDRLGNLAYTDYGGKFLVELYTEPFLSLDGKPRISLYFFEGKEKRNLAKLSPQTRDARQRYEKMFEKNKGPGYLFTMKDADKRLFSICMYLGKFVSLLTEPPGSLTAPTDHFLTLEELSRKFPLLIPNIKNPYTNQPIQEVSFYNPSPGNFTIVFRANEYDNTILSSEPICYDEENHYIVPRDFIVLSLLNGEEVGGHKLILR